MDSNKSSHCMENGHVKESHSSLLNNNNNTKKNGEDACGWRCGSKYSSCFFLQPFATAKWSLMFLSSANFMFHLVFSGLIGVVISTLEKRFELRSMESASIASMGNLGQGAITIVCVLVSSRVDKPRTIGWGLVISGLATIMFGIPHFTATEYSYVEDDIFNYCGNVTNPSCTVSSMKHYLYWFITCCCLIGAGTAPMTIYSVTYLDENVPKRDSTFYCALYYAIGGLGPALGFVLGGLSLEIYAYPLKDSDEVTITSSSYSWIGAWWIGFLVSGALKLLIAIPILLLPKQIPGTDKHRSDRNGDAQKSHFKSIEGNEEKSGVLVILSDVMSLLRNMPYVLMTLGSTLNYALIFGFSTFGAKYLESVFGLTPFHSSLLFGIAAIFASFGAQIISGIIVKKLNLQVVGILKYMIIAGILSVLCSIGFLLHCEDIDFAGGTVPYFDSNETKSLFSTCNNDCSCSTDRYAPVCANGVTYFSPCFAGCQTQLNETFYTDCSCVEDNFSRVDRDVIVSSESCDWKACDTIIPFVFVVFICFFTSILTTPTSTQVTLRCVPFKKRDMALSIQQGVIHLVGIIPGRLLVGYVLDRACVAWSTECGEQGSCKVYNRGDIARNNTILLVLQTTICIIAYALTLFTYKPVKESDANGSAPEDVELMTLAVADEAESKEI